MLMFMKILERVLIVSLMILVAVALAACGVVTPVPTATATTIPTPTPTSVQDLSTPIYTPTSQYLDTPTLIKQAFDRREIAEEERLLYLAYALYEYKSLPPQYLSSVGWFGDAAVGELIEAVNSPAKLCSMSPHIRSELLRLVKKTDVDTVCN